MRRRLLTVILITILLNQKKKCSIFFYIQIWNPGWILLILDKTDLTLLISHFFILSITDLIRCNNYTNKCPCWAKFHLWLKVHLGYNGLEPFNTNVPAILVITFFFPTDSLLYFLWKEINNVERLLKKYIYIIVVMMLSNPLWDILVSFSLTRYLLSSPSLCSHLCFL